jgi:hypothetical protein
MVEELRKEYEILTGKYEGKRLLGVGGLIKLFGNTFARTSNI